MFPGNSPVNLYRVCCAIDLSCHIGCPTFSRHGYWWFRLGEKKRKKEAALAWIQPAASFFCEDEEDEEDLGMTPRGRQKWPRCSSNSLCLSHQIAQWKKKILTWVCWSIKKVKKKKFRDAILDSCLVPSASLSPIFISMLMVLNQSCQSYVGNVFFPSPTQVADVSWTPSVIPLWWFCTVHFLAAVISGKEILLITSGCLGHKLHNTVMLHNVGAYIMQPCLSIYCPSDRTHKYKSY